MTLLEVVFGLLIFGAGVVVIMHMVTKNIHWIHELSYKNTATLLAKEWLEVAFHQRDMMYSRGLPWSCIGTDATGVCDRFLLDEWANSSLYRLVAHPTVWYRIEPLQRMEDSRLYTISLPDAATWYTHRASWIPVPDSAYGSSPFSRYITVRPVDEMADIEEYVLMIESTVMYTVWGNTHQVVLESLLGDIY